MPENPPEDLNQQQNHDHDGDEHLARLLAPSSLSTPFYLSLYNSIQELIHPKKLPPLEITSKPDDKVQYGTSLYQGNEWKAAVASLAINGGIIGLLLLIGLNKTVQDTIKEEVKLVLPADLIRKPPPIPPKQQTAGGGGGGAEKLPESKGKLPKIAPKQFVPPTVHTVDNPKLPMTPTIIASADLPNIDMNNIGDPLAGLGTPSNGNGGGGGIGPGKGPGVGPGTGGGFGGGAFRIGGGVSQPIPILKPEPEYSEEARKAKHQGEVLLTIVVDEKGVPTEIKVARKLGLGLDEKAIEAVQKWRFKPGMKDGKPVKVIATIAVTFHLL